MSTMEAIADIGVANAAARERVVTSPAGGNAFAVAFADVGEAIRRAPVWLNDGWINIVWRFRRTLIGPFWHTLGLAGFIVTMGVIWSVVLKVDFYSYFRYITVNMIAWTLIASFISDGASSLVSSQGTALSMRFSYIAFAFGTVWRSLLLLAHHFVLYLVMVAVTMHPPGPVGLLAIPALALLVVNGAWITLLVGMACLRWRDLLPAVSTAMQVLILVTPVFWPREMLGEKMAKAADFNPLYHFITIFREPLLGTAPHWHSWAVAGGLAVFGPLITLWIYGRVRYKLPYWY